MRNKPGLLILILAAFLAACNNIKKADTALLGGNRVRMVVNDDTINQTDVFTVIKPVWLSIDIYGTPEEYTQSQKKYTENQRCVSAIMWYSSEVNNGGHSQFFENATGIVWKDALEGFKRIGLTENYNILKEAADRVNGNPSLDRSTRIEELETSKAKFDDVDDRFYATSPDSLIHEFIKQNRRDFYFDGEVEQL